MIDLIGCLTIQCRVRPTLIVPARIQRKLYARRILAKWHENNARAFVLQGQDESLDQGNTPVLADGAEAGCDPFAITPGLEHVAPELLSLIADDVFGRGTCVIDGAFEEALNR